MESLLGPSSLLSPSESHAFQSFLSSIAEPSQALDWNIDIDVPKDKQALAKATKDLMALDSSHWPTTTPSQDPHLPLFLPHQSHQPNSHSSSRTPTPTSASPYPSFQSLKPSNRRRTSHPHSHPYPHHPPSPSPSVSSAPVHPHPQPRQRRTPSHQHPHAQPPSTALPQKPALLSADQKKANHIQSEQKRRANIRRGYEALCDCVPALREAIREEEEALELAASQNGSQTLQGVSQGKRKKIALKGEEKIDGRAGPKSENVVLSKTIEHINDLLDERSALLARLHRARSSLPPGHPALMTPLPVNDMTARSAEDEGPLWEREWKGGHGNLGNVDEDGDESS